MGGNYRRRKEKYIRFKYLYSQTMYYIPKHKLLLCMSFHALFRLGEFGDMTCKQVSLKNTHVLSTGKCTQ